MARRKHGALSQSVRDYIAANPKAGPKQIKEGLKDQGVKVSASLVSAVKYGKGKTRKTRVPAVRVAARKTRTRKASVTIEQLLAVKRLADSLGGADQVRQALETLQQLQ